MSVRAPGWREMALSDRATGAGTVALRPMTMGDLLDDPFVILRAHLRTILLVTAVVVVPLQLVSAFLQRGSFGGLGFLEVANNPMAAQAAFEAGDPGGAIAIGVSVLAAATVMPLVNGVVARLGISAVLGETLSTGEALRAGLRRWPALVGTWLAAAVVTYGPALVGVGLMLTGEPALVAAGSVLLLAGLVVAVAAYVLFYPAPAVVVAEGVRPMVALRRCLALVRPRFFPVLGVVLLAALVASLVQSALAGVPSVAAMGIGLQDGWVLLGVGGIAAELVVAPYRALVATFVYLDGRVRTEGLDLQVLVHTRSRGSVQGA